MALAKNTNIIWHVNVNGARNVSLNLYNHLCRLCALALSKNCYVFRLSCLKGLDNCIFPFAAILKHKQVAYHIQISLFFPEIFKLLKYSN